MKKHQWAIALATTYLIVYTLLFETGASLLLLSTLFALSPVVLVWMVYSILRFAPYTGRTLQANEEYGYADKRTEDLKTF
jgi:hypothetical protein